MNPYVGYYKEREKFLAAVEMSLVIVAFNLDGATQHFIADRQLSVIE